MKKTLLTLTVIVITVVMLHAFRIIRGTAITGRISPPQQLEGVYCFSGSDTIRATIGNRTFALTVKPGTWKVVIDAKDPFRDVIFEKVDAQENHFTDLGEIQLQR
ncbi:MAG TPA: hypothetical protein VM012_08280 [Flavitalea sp.]|nr:hypothetical protein [Flavitalea sp.]